MDIDQDLTTVAGFLARRDVPGLDLLSLSTPVDFVVLLGSSLLLTAEVAAYAWMANSTERILVAGGIGHSTQLLYDVVQRSPLFSAVKVEGRSEAEILAEILVDYYDIPSSAIMTETHSTNCGLNAWEVKRVLQKAGLSPERLVLIQDPTMQRRSHASFERAWRGENAPEFISYAPFIPSVSDGAVTPENQWSWERFVSLVIGEIPRLLDTPGGYGPSGQDFIEHVDIPQEVLVSHARLVAWSGQTTRA